MSSFEKADPFWQLIPSGWHNVFCARMLASMDDFCPFDVLDEIRCPVLLVGGEHDDLVLSTTLREAAERLGSGTMAMLDCGHFAVYRAPMLAENLAHQSAFLRMVRNGQRATAG